MPAGSPRYEGQQPSYGYDYGQKLDYSGINGGDESAATILQSVKEQEAQFEQLTRELEAERQSVANQLEKCKFGSETASMSSISSTDESFKWKPPQLHDPIDEESDTESKVSGSHLVDSCLKVLQGRGLMGNIGEDPSEYLPPQDQSVTEHPPNNNMNEPSGFVQPAIPRYDDASVNGPGGHYSTYAAYEQNSPNASMQPQMQSSQRTVTTVTRTAAYHSGNQGDSQSPRDTSSYSYQQQQFHQYQGDQDANRFQSDPQDLGPQGSMSYLATPQQYPDNTQLHDGYQGLRFVEREPVARVSNDYPESPYESLQKDDRTDSFDQQFSYRDESQLGPGNYPRDHQGDPSQQLDQPQHGYEQRQFESQHFQSHSVTEQEQYGVREPPTDSFRNPPQDANAYRDGNYGYHADDDRYSDRYNDSFNGRQDPNYPREDGPLDPRFRDSPQGSPRPDVYTGDNNKYPQDGGSYGKLPYGDMPPHSPTGSDIRVGTQQYGETVVMESMQRITIQEQQHLQQQHSPHGGDSRGLMPPYNDGGPYGGGGQPPYDDRQDSMRESEPYSSRQNSMRDPGPYTVGTGGERPYGEGQADLYGSRQNSIRDLQRDPYGSRQDSIRNLTVHTEERQESIRDMRDQPPYGSQQLGSPFDGEPPLAQGSQDPLAPPFNPAGSQSRLNRSMSNQGSQLRLAPSGSEKGSMQRLANPPQGPYDNRGYDDDDIPRQESVQLAGMPEGGGYDLGMLRKTPSINSQNMAIFGDQKFRDPDLPEVIEYLSHPSNAIKANAAAYLQHLCFTNDDVKARTRNLGGIPALVELVKNEIPEVHRAACGSLRNLSYGRSNDENKRAIRNAGGIQDLVRLLRKSPDNDVRELVTGILWNLSSCHDLKRPIIDEGLSTIVNTVVIPHAQMDSNQGYDPYRHQDTYWPTVFRNASGVLRNVSSEGEYARKKLRECEGLVDSILFIVKTAIGKNDIDNKSVENCVCILRNLSYACQEVQDPEYLARREKQAKAAAKGDTTGCFGGKSNKKAKQDKKGQNNNPPLQTYQSSRRPGEPIRGMELLWQPEVFHVYQPLLSECTNPETLEAAAGAIQNLAACDWQPSADIRTQVRKEKAMPILVELLKLEADRVVCASATALRNLALDPKNKELIGKYAIGDLVSKLPSDDPARQSEYPVSDETICAVESTLYEVIKSNPEHARTLLSQGGVEKLMYITRTRHKFSPKVVKFASSLLYAMWQFKELHPEYKKRGWKEQDFVTKTMAAKSSHANGDPTTPNNTLNRPAMTMGQPAMSQNTMPAVTRTPGGQLNNPMYTAVDTSRNTPNLSDRYGGPQQPESYPLQQMGGGSTRDLHGGGGNVPDHGYYPSMDSRGSGDRQDSSRYPQDQYPQHPDTVDQGYNARLGAGPPSDQESFSRGPPSEQGSNYHQQGPGGMDTYRDRGLGSEHGGSNIHLQPHPGDPYNRVPGSEHGSNYQLHQQQQPEDPYGMAPPSEQGSYRPSNQNPPHDPYGRASSEQGSFRNAPPPQDSFRNPPESYTHSGPPSEHGSYRPNPHNPSQDNLPQHTMHERAGAGDHYQDDWQRPPSEMGGYGEDPYGQLRHYEGDVGQYPGDQDDRYPPRELNNSMEPPRGDFIPAGAVPLFPMNHTGSRDLVTHDPNNEPLYAKVVKENKRRTDNYSSERQGALGNSGGGGGQGADSWV